MTGRMIASVITTQYRQGVTIPRKRPKKTRNPEKDLKPNSVYMLL